MKEILLVSAIWATFGGGLMLSANTAPPDTNDPKFYACEAKFDANQIDRHSWMPPALTPQDYNRFMAICMGKDNG